MLKPAALLALLSVLAACGSGPEEAPQTTGEQSAPVMSPNPTADGITPGDSNTTLPAATPEEAAPPPEP